MKKAFITVFIGFYVLATILIAVMANHIRIQNETITFLRARSFECTIFQDDPPFDVLWYNLNLEVVGWAQFTPFGFAIHDGQSYRIYSINRERLVDKFITQGEPK